MAARDTFSKFTAGSATVVSGATAGSSGSAYFPLSGLNVDNEGNTFGAKIIILKAAIGNGAEITVSNRGIGTGASTDVIVPGHGYSLRASGESFRFEYDNPGEIAMCAPNGGASLVVEYLILG